MEKPSNYRIITTGKQESSTVTANRLAVTRIHKNDRDFTALISLDANRKFTELSVFEPEEESLLDRIYVARVERIVPGIHAAFLRLDAEQKAYLPLSHMEDAIFTKRQSQKKPLCEGDELLVQVTKEAVKTKDPIASVRLTLAGRYCLLQSGVSGVSISKKIIGEQRKELQMLLTEYLEAKAEPEKQENNSILAFQQRETDACKQLSTQSNIMLTNKSPNRPNDYLGSVMDINSYGLLLRTNALQASQKEMLQDIDELQTRWQNLRAQVPHLSCGLVTQEARIPAFIRAMQSISYEDIEAVCTDDAALYEAIDYYLPYLRRQGKLEFYNNTQVSLSVLYNINSNIDSLLARRVWLPSGGNLIIDPVEAMTVIDVNSAKGSRDRDSLLRTNVEAAVEIPRQLRLRNISGMILIDFINMEEETAQEQFLSVLKGELRRDFVPANFIDITKLGLVELTRQKRRKSLAEVIRTN